MKLASFVIHGTQEDFINGRIVACERYCESLEINFHSNKIALGTLFPVILARGHTSPNHLQARYKPNGKVILDI